MRYDQMSRRVRAHLREFERCSVIPDLNDQQRLRNLQVVYMIIHGTRNVLYSLPLAIPGHTASDAHHREV